MEAKLQVAVDASALQELLQALAGPSHHIMELKVTTRMPNNPIKILTDQYNAMANLYSAEKSDRTEPINHEVKCDAEYYDKVEAGLKRFEYRLNDRDYREGDTLTLIRTDEEGNPTGQRSTYLVTYVLENSPRVPLNFVVMTIERWSVPEEEQLCLI